MLALVTTGGMLYICYTWYYWYCTAYVSTRYNIETSPHLLAERLSASKGHIKELLYSLYAKQSQEFNAYGHCTFNL